MGLLNEKDQKIVGERLSKLARPVTLAVFTQEFECEMCRQTRELVEEIAAISGAKVNVEVYDLVKDKATADAMGIDKIPAIAVLGPSADDRGIRFYGIPAGTSSPLSWRRWTWWPAGIRASPPLPRRSSRP